MKITSSLLTIVSLSCTGQALTTSRTTAPSIASRDVIEQGTNNGYFYSTWADTSGIANYTNGEGGTFSLDWAGQGWLIAGKGWNPGTDTRIITYNGTYQPSGTSDLAVYGWTRNPLVEYYIVESYYYLTPTAGATRRGTTTCNGVQYNLFSSIRVNQSSIDGIQTFTQFWSLRQPRKNPGAVSGQVDMGCHTTAWKSVGMNLGSEHNYQIVAVDGYFSRGYATLTVA